MQNYADAFQERSSDSFQCIDSSEIILPLYYNRLTYRNRPIFSPRIKNYDPELNPLLAALLHPKGTTSK